MRQVQPKVQTIGGQSQSGDLSSLLPHQKLLPPQRILKWETLSASRENPEMGKLPPQRILKQDTFVKSYPDPTKNPEMREFLCDSKDNSEMGPCKEA